ncbi:DUF4011 domain-containing protein, partial [Anaerosporobacter sp.]|uniref:DUF4011 domain-containing protein n=1 Tax=Anaerosporobacter sp. TaxID=1872529 RepID=UPI00286F18AA
MKKITMEAQINETIHYALQQNCIPMIRSLVITNSSEEIYTDITVKVSFQPEFAVPYEVTINCLKPNEPVELSPIRMIPSMEYLVSLTEKVEGKLTIEVKEAQECICSETWQVGILAYDQWTGINYLPEMVAAYVTPMHPKVTDIVKRAEKYLKAWGNVERFTGYQTKSPEQVEEQMKAVYTALQDCELELEVPTVSYETNGQWLHLPEMVVEEGKGTALELSLLYISCLEAIGLNPMLVFLRGHVFPGCHMEEESLGECVEEDITVLLAKNEDASAKIQFIECTDIIRDHCVDFMQAKKDAREHISNTEMFVFAIDIKSSRISGICPLPLRIQKDGRYVTVDVITNKTSDMSEEFLGYNYRKREESNESNEQAKFKLWESKLLNLSLYNTLLNFTKTKATLQLMTANLFELEDQIVSGEQYTIMCKPKDSANMRSGLNIYPIQKDVEYIEAIATSEFTHRRIRTFLEEEELGEALKNIYRQARSSIEENGANTLYLALGFLQWYDSKQSKEARYAPLVLIPVEILRRGVSDIYAIQIRDEEVQMNMVLLEMLHREHNIDISGLDSLPMDECGVDLSCVFREVRKGIEGKANWSVEEYAFLGLFSFNEFIMWRDIHNRAEELKKNKLVASLLSGKLEWTPQKDAINTKQLGEQVAPVNEAVLLRADSTQLDAIYTASKGQSFVLQGPPGTGKSQTIVNIITDALFHDKTVLFVAQKKTALSVVWKRLEKLGLGSFCLEMHSDKVQKAELLSKLNQTLQMGKTKANGEYEQTAIQVQTIRQELNRVVEAIHRRREYGMSLSEAISRYEAHKQYKDILTIDDTCVAKLKEGTYEEWLETLRQCKRASEECKEGIHNVFKYYKNPNYSLELRETFAKLCKEFEEDLLQLEENCQEFERALGIQMEGTYSNYKAFADLLDYLSNAKYQIDSLMLEPENEKKEKNMSDIIACGKEYVSLEKELAQIFEAEIYEYDVNSAYAEWKQASSKWLIRRMLTQSKLIKEMRAYAKAPLDIDKHTVTIWYNKLIKRIQLSDYLTSLDAAATGHFSYQWQGVHTNWETLELALHDTLQLRGALSEITLEREEVITAIQKLGKLVALNGQKKEYLQNEIRNYLACWQLCMVKEVEFVKQYEAQIDCFHQETNWITRTREELLNWKNHIGELRDWSNLLQQVEQVKRYGFHSVADAFLLEEMQAEEIIKSFICNVNLAIIKRTIVAEPILMDFQGVKFEDTMKQYQEVTEEFKKLATEELIAKLSSRIPRVSEQGEHSSELAILQKAINDVGRMTNIRELFAQTQTVITRICPCMLVSPTSAAQYLDESFNKFDYVIFDEASQIPTCEAVGVAARGEHVIIVGDSKQLPPTSSLRDTYYDMMNSELEDYESVFDACVALPMPQKHLLWHYRSHHESLIAYSNAKYYGQCLYTYPPSNEMDSKVTLVSIEGACDKGTTKQNQEEAAAIVNEICNRLLDNEQRNDSIGVITFSLAQQYLIEDLLEKEFENNLQLCEIQKGMQEPILIKYVDAVQGEERDVILLSVGYGADKEGKLS